MPQTGIIIEADPQLKNPVLVAGFSGWGNALNVSEGMVTYLAGKLGAESLARLNPDLFYRYDELRPLVNIEDGDLITITPPGGSFSFVRLQPAPRDLVILKADEPNLCWFQFVDELFALCKRFGIETVITLGSMYDNVLHTDRIISGLSTSEIYAERLRERKISSVSYQGPGAIHSLINAEGAKRGFACISLWCHCPYYLQGATHFGLLSHLGALLSDLGGFDLDTSELESGWDQLNEQIQALIDNSPDLQSAIQELRKAKVRGSWAGLKSSSSKSDKVINLRDFLEPK